MNIIFIILVLLVLLIYTVGNQIHVSYIYI